MIKVQIEMAKMAKSKNWAWFKGIEQNHQKAYKLEILSECSFNQEKCSIQFWVCSQHGKVIKMGIELAKLRNLAGIWLITLRVLIVRN